MTAILVSVIVMKLFTKTFEYEIADANKHAHVQCLLDYARLHWATHRLFTESYAKFLRRCNTLDLKEQPAPLEIKGLLNKSKEHVRRPVHVGWSYDRVIQSHSVCVFTMKKHSAFTILNVHVAPRTRHCVLILQ